MDIHSEAHQSDPDKAGDNEEGKYTHEQQLELKMRMQDIEHELAQLHSQIQKLAGLLHDLKVHIDPEGQAISDRQRYGGHDANNPQSEQAVMFAQPGQRRVEIVGLCKTTSKPCKSCTAFLDGHR